MSARVQIEPHEGVAGLQQGQKHRLVHLAARIGLNVGIGRTEQLLRPLDCQRFGHVHELAAAVIALARIALGIFVGHHGTLRLHHGPADDVFRGNQLNLMALTTKLCGDRSEHFGVARRQGFGEKAGNGGHGVASP